MMDTPWPESSKDRDMPMGRVRDWGCHQAWAAEVRDEGRARMQPGSLSLSLSLPTMSYREERETLGMLPGGGSLELVQWEWGRRSLAGQGQEGETRGPSQAASPPWARPQ